MSIRDFVSAYVRPVKNKSRDITPGDEQVIRTYCSKCASMSSIVHRESPDAMSVTHSRIGSLGIYPSINENSSTETPIFLGWFHDPSESRTIAKYGSVTKAFKDRNRMCKSPFWPTHNPAMYILCVSYIHLVCAHNITRAGPPSVSRNTTPTAQPPNLCLA